MTARTDMLSQDRCPACGSPLIAGPRGGASKNMYCTDRTHCRQGFNVTRFAGLVALEQGIGEIDDERFAIYTNPESYDHARKAH